MSAIQNAGDLVMRVVSQLQPSRPDSPVDSSRVERARILLKEELPQWATDHECADIFERCAQASFGTERHHERYLYATGRPVNNGRCGSQPIQRPQSPMQGFEATSQRIFRLLQNAVNSSDVSQLFALRERISTFCGRGSREVALVQRRIILQMIFNDNVNKQDFLHEVHFYSKIEIIDFCDFSGLQNERSDFNLIVLKDASKIIEAALLNDDRNLEWLEDFLKFCYKPMESGTLNETLKEWFEGNDAIRSEQMRLLGQLDSKITLGFISSEFINGPMH